MPVVPVLRAAVSALEGWGPISQGLAKAVESTVAAVETWQTVNLLLLIYYKLCSGDLCAF